MSAGYSFVFVTIWLICQCSQNIDGHKRKKTSSWKKLIFCLIWDSSWVHERKYIISVSMSLSKLVWKNWWPILSYIRRSLRFMPEGGKCDRNSKPARSANQKFFGSARFTGAFYNKQTTCWYVNSVRVNPTVHTNGLQSQSDACVFKISCNDRVFWDAESVFVNWIMALTPGGALLTAISLSPRSSNNV